MQSNEMNTLYDVLNTLKQRNINTEFSWQRNALYVNDKAYDPSSLQIVKTYRFEGESDPDDAAILYIIKADDGLIGYSIDAYGVNSNYDEAYDNFIRQIPIAGHDEQIAFEL